MSENDLKKWQQGGPDKRSRMMHRRIRPGSKKGYHSVHLKFSLSDLK